MEILDFLPKYPNIYNTSYNNLNFYNDSFEDALFHKKEFYENRLLPVENFPRERGTLTKYQKTISRYMSSNTPYDSVLLVHAMGTGKTCSAIGAIEQIRSENSTFNGALILAKGEQILDNFMEELVYKCTEGQYIPDNYQFLTDLQKKHRIRKRTKFYQFNTFFKFKKEIQELKDEDVAKIYSNKIIVIDEVHNLRIQDEDIKDTTELYNSYHKFLHLVKNCKILLLSGTPMKDVPEEIAAVLNLILPLNTQLPTGKAFLDNYMYSEGNAYKFLPEKINEIKNIIRGRVSFLREEYSTIPKIYIGEKNVGTLKHFIVYPVNMSDFQSSGYAQAYMADTSGQAGVFSNSREASLFVYPDGSYGKAGFEKYIEELGKDRLNRTITNFKFKLRPELKNFLEGKTHAQTLDNIRNCSTVYAEIIENILNSPGNCFIYSSVVRGSGAILLGLLLNLFGFQAANGTEKDQGLRYAILTNETASTPDIRRIAARFNNKDNIQGKFIKVIIGSRSVSEGFSFKNVVFEAIVTPHWNYSETAQALARGIRLGSHNDLILAGISPEIRIMQTVAIPNPLYTNFSIDLHMYQISEDKDISIRSILRMLMEIAFDCALNYMRNRVNGEDNTRDCDYTTCDYKCDGINQRIVMNGLEDKELDYSTYQLFYANPRIPAIKRKIENMFRINNKLTLSSIIDHLKSDFSEDEINNALITMTEETESTEYDYKTFLQYYSKSPVKKISDRIEELFREHFRLELNTIFDQFPDNTHFEVLTALRNLIIEDTIIVNKYGFPSYLREESNIFFLVNNLSVNSDRYSEYYNQNLCIRTNKTFSEIMESFSKQSVINIVKNICNNLGKFEDIIKVLPKEIQEIFIEASIQAEENDIKYNENLRKKILEHFKAFIKVVDDSWVITLRKDEGILRCKKYGTTFDNWENCDQEYDRKVTQADLKELQDIKQKASSHGIMGAYNPEKKAFCILDLTKNAGEEDRRKKITGKVCQNWKRDELLNIAIQRLSMPIPDNLYVGYDDYTRKSLYWNSFTTKDLCQNIENFLRTQGLVIDDINCGVQGKKDTTKTIKENVEDKKRKSAVKSHFQAFMVIPNATPNFNEYKSAIKKLAESSFNPNIQINSQSTDQWVLIYKGNNMMGFFHVTSDGYISELGITASYTTKTNIQKGIDVIKTGMNLYCSQNMEPPPIVLPTTLPKFRNIQTLYEKLGLTVISTDNNYYVYQYKC